MRRGPYQQNPFGPFPAEDAAKDAGDVERHTSNTVDMRGAADWRPVFSVDCGDASWGQVVVTCEAIASPTVANATAVENWPSVEVRIAVYVNGQQFVVLEAAVGNHNSAIIGNDTKSAGPVVLHFAPGEVPDKVEVLARARRGGLAETAGDPDEKLDLVAVSRFHK